MNREDVLRMAREAGLTDPDLGDWMTDYGHSEVAIKKFAAAIRSATKEEDAGICEQEATFSGEGKKDAAALNCADAIRASK